MTCYCVLTGGMAWLKIDSASKEVPAVVAVRACMCWCLTKGRTLHELFSWLLMVNYLPGDVPWQEIPQVNCTITKALLKSCIIFVITTRFVVFSIS